MNRQGVGKNTGYIILITLIFLVLLAFGQKERENRELYFTLENGRESVRILPYTDEDGKQYVFLPSYAELSALRVWAPAGESVSLGERTLTDGMYCDGFALENTYGLSVDGVWESDLIFLRSDNLPSLHIDTASGTMARIHQDKENQEEASVTLFGNDGMLQFFDAGSLINGRGNYTWEQEKKPYSLELSYPGALLGMGSSDEWILLANVADGSNLNNKLVFDLANQFFPEWSPRCEFVDLYLNGDYAGLYLLTERIEAGRDKLDLDLTAGEYLCRIDYPGRLEIIPNPIVTQAGRVAYVSEPKRPSDAEKTEMARQIQQLEVLILSGEDLSEVEWFDLDSWVRRYLIDEISANGDSDLASSYFYWKDGAFHAGPVWDYDVCFGNRNGNRAPDAFFAKNLHKELIHKSPYYHALYQNPSFVSRVREIYREELVPLLEDLCKTELHRQTQKIAASATMDHIRWKELYDFTFSYGLLFMTTPDFIEDYLDKRIAFLNTAWIDGVRYVTLQFDGEVTRIFSVPEGQLLQIEDEEILGNAWTDVETGELFDPAQPVTRDMFLQVVWTPEPAVPAAPEEDPAEEPAMPEEIPAEEPAAPEAAVEEPPQSEEAPAPEKREVSTRAVVSLASLLLMFGVFVGLAVKDGKNQKPKSRRKEKIHE